MTKETSTRLTGNKQPTPKAKDRSQKETKTVIQERKAHPHLVVMATNSVTTKMIPATKTRENQGRQMNQVKTVAAVEMTLQEDPPAPAILTVRRLMPRSPKWED